MKTRVLSALHIAGTKLLITSRLAQVFARIRRRFENAVKYIHAFRVAIPLPPSANLLTSAIKAPKGSSCTPADLMSQRRNFLARSSTSVYSCCSCPLKFTPTNATLKCAVTSSWMALA